MSFNTEITNAEKIGTDIKPYASSWHPENIVVYCLRNSEVVEVTLTIDADRKGYQYRSEGKESLSHTARLECAEIAMNYVCDDEFLCKRYGVPARTELTRAVEGPEPAPKRVGRSRRVKRRL